MQIEEDIRRSRDRADFCMNLRRSRELAIEEMRLNLKRQREAELNTALAESLYRESLLR
jgi:hypothetical protein